MNILIIDDNAIKGNWVKTEIQNEVGNCHFYFAQTGVEGIEILQQQKEKIDFLVLDMQFSYNGNGDVSEEACLRVLQEIRDNPLIHELPICICSAGGKWMAEFDTFKNVKAFIRYQDHSAGEKFYQLLCRL